MGWGQHPNQHRDMNFQINSFRRIVLVVMQESAAIVIAIPDSGSGDSHALTTDIRWFSGP